MIKRTLFVLGSSCSSLQRRYDANICKLFTSYSAMKLLVRRPSTLPHKPNPTPLFPCTEPHFLRGSRLLTTCHPIVSNDIAAAQIKVAARTFKPYLRSSGEPAIGIDSYPLPRVTLELTCWSERPALVGMGFSDLFILLFVLVLCLVLRLLRFSLGINRIPQRVINL